LNRRTSAVSADLRCGERANADEGEQGRGELVDDAGDLAFEGAFANGEVTGVLDDLGCDARDRTIETLQPGSDRLEVLVGRERSSGRVPGCVELVEVPAKPVEATGPFRDQVLAMIDQQS
jgi:hypothetical protein